MILVFRGVGNNWAGSRRVADNASEAELCDTLCDALATDVPVNCLSFKLSVEYSGRKNLGAIYNSATRVGEFKLI